MCREVEDSARAHRIEDSQEEFDGRSGEGVLETESLVAPTCDRSGSSEDIVSFCLERGEESSADEPPGTGNENRTRDVAD